MRVEVAVGEPVERQYERAYGRFSVDVFRFVLAWTNDWTSAEDLTQETYLQLWQHRGNQQPPRSRQVAGRSVQGGKEGSPFLFREHAAQIARLLERVRWVEACARYVAFGWKLSHAGS